MYEIEQLVQVARRENNSQRSYLYVNPLQGKHIPVEPNKTKEMCRCLAQEINKRYEKERIFIIGFAETATAISAYVASFLEQIAFYQNTTREDIEDAHYLYFTESHSHATEQKLNIKWFDDYLSMVDRIIFVEDEVTTGNTILKLIGELERNFSGHKNKYSIASILNSMSEERVEELCNSGIDCIWLRKIPYEYRTNTLKQYDSSTSYMYDYSEYTSTLPVDYLSIGNGINPSSTCRFSDYISNLNHLCRKIYRNEFMGRKYQRILVLGTEECMFPAIEVAGYLQDKHICEVVKTHSTTRSPIMAYAEKEYPLKARYRLCSLYDDERITYLYNLEKYDKVIIVTDSKLVSLKGLSSLLYALESVENNDIAVYQWRI